MYADCTTDSPPLCGLSALSETDIREAAIAFVNTSVTPGLEGATLKVDNDQRQSDQWRSSLGFTAEFTIRDHIVNGYWGLAIVGGSLDDKVFITADDGSPVMLNLKRELIGARGTLGLSFPVNRYFKLRPSLTTSLSRMHTDTIIDGQSRTTQSGDIMTQMEYNTDANMLTNIASIAAAYSRWYGDKRLELMAEYNLLRVDVFSENNPILDARDWNQTALLKARYSGPTSLSTGGRPWRWQAYASHTNFISHDKTSLGYTGLFEVGGGIEWHLNIKPLDWFGWQAVGISLGLITSRNVEGINIGLTAR